MDEKLKSLYRIMGAAVVIAIVLGSVIAYQRCGHPHPKAELKKVMAKVMGSTPPWVRQFQEVRRVKVADYPALISALANSQVGDVIQLQDGVTYKGGDIRISKGDVKILCEKGEHCTIEDYLLMDAPNIWLEGIEYKSHAYKNINFFSSNGGIVNCVIHGDGTQDQVGVFANADKRVNGGTMVFYGNIVYSEQYASYVQNTKGYYKYWVNNYLADVVYPSQPWIIHNYAQSKNKVEDIHYIDNVIVSGSVLTGGQGDPNSTEGGGTPPIEIEFKKNVFYKSGSQGFKRPFNLQFIDNWFIRSKLSNDFMWGEGENWFPYPSTPFTVTGNVFWNPGAIQVYYRTSRYPCNGCTREDGVGKFRSSDVVAGNQYFGGFNAQVDANGGTLTTTSLTQWQNATAGYGLKMDGNSSVNPAVMPNGYKLVVNDYDPDRAMLTVWNLNSAAGVTIDLPRPADLYAVKDVYGHKVGMVPKGSSLFGQTSEFESYLVKFTAEQAGCNCDLNKADLELVKALGYVDAGRKVKAKASINNARTIIAPCKNP